MTTWNRNRMKKVGAGVYRFSLSVPSGQHAAYYIEVRDIDGKRIPGVFTSDLMEERP